MKCKYCQAELDEGVTLCPVCGKDNAEESAPVEPVEVEILEDIQMPELEVEVPEAEETGEEGAPEESIPEEEAPAEEEAPRKKKGKVVAIVCACVVLVAALAAALWYGINGGWTPKANDVYYKDTYYGTAEEVAKNADTVVATIGDKELTNNQLQVFYWMQFYDFLDYYGSMISYIGLDYTAPLDTQYISDTETWQQYFLELALSNWQRYQTMCIEAENAGFAVNEEMRANLDAMPETVEEMAASYGYENATLMIQDEMGQGASIDAYLNYLELYYTGSEYLNTLYTPTEDEILAYFTEHEEDYASSGIYKDATLVDVRHILLMPEGDTEEQWEECRVKAQELYDSWLAGEATEDSFAALAVEYSEDGSASSGGLYTGVYEGQMVTNFNDWCFDETRAYGDNDLIQTEYGYHIMYFVGSGISDEWYETAQSDLTSETLRQILTDAMEQHPMEVNYKKICIGTNDLSTDAE